MKKRLIVLTVLGLVLAASLMILGAANVNALLSVVPLCDNASDSSTCNQAYGGQGCMWENFKQACLINFQNIDFNILTCGDVCFKCDTQNACEETGMSNSSHSESCAWDPSGPSGSKCKSANEMAPGGPGGPPCDEACNGCGTQTLCESLTSEVRMTRWTKWNESQNGGFGGNMFHGENGVCYWVVNPFDTADTWCSPENETCAMYPDLCANASDCNAYNTSNQANLKGMHYQWDGDIGMCIYAGVESCFNGKDDDANNLIDCADPNCRLDSYCIGQDDWMEPFNFASLFHRMSPNGNPEVKIRVNNTLLNNWNLTCSPHCNLNSQNPGDLPQPQDDFKISICTFGKFFNYDSWGEANLQFQNIPQDLEFYRWCNHTNSNESQYVHYFIVNNATNHNKTLTDWFRASISQGGLGVPDFTKREFDHAVVEMSFSNFEPGPPIELGRDSLGDQFNGDTDLFDIDGLGMKLNNDDGIAAFGIMFNDIHPAGQANGPVWCYDTTNSFSQFTNGLGSMPSLSPNYTINQSSMVLIDTDANQSSGCNETLNGTMYSGFEYKITVKNGINASNDTIQEKLISRCTNGEFSPTPKKVKSMDTLGCMVGAQLLMVNLNDIGNPSDTIRFMAAVSHETGFNQSNASFNNVTDIIVNAYYTPGSVDFVPNDCEADPFACGGAFLNVGGGEYMPMENCYQGYLDHTTDFDKDGKSGCADPDCTFMPFCSAQYDPFADTQAPSIIQMHKDVFDRFIHVSVDTDEPTNISMSFYKNDSQCSTVNETVLENFGSYNGQGIQFNIFHHITLRDGVGGITLNPDSSYYYKIEVCDKALPTARCAKSACLNVNTTGGLNASNAIQMNFTVSGFEIHLDIPQTGIDINLSNSTYNNVFNFTNTSQIRGVNLSLVSPGGDFEITLTDVDFAKGKKVNMTGGFYANSSGGTYGKFLGMEPSLFQEVAKTFGAKDIELTMPGTAQTLYKCADNGTNCTEVNASYYDYMGASGGKSTFKVTPALGFSTYTNYGESESGNVSITTDRNAYFCVRSSGGERSCVITLNLTNSNASYNGRTWNITINFSSYDTQKISYKIAWFNNGMWINDSTFNVSTFPDFNLSNESRIFKVNLTMFVAVATNLSIKVGFNGSADLAPANLSTYAYVDFVNHTGSYSAPGRTVATGSDFSWTYLTKNDNLGGNCRVVVNSTDASASTPSTDGSETNATTNFTGTGAYDYVIRCTDTQTGESGDSVSQRVYFDNTAPTVNYAADMVNFQNVSATFFNVKFNFTDNNYTTASCSIYLNSTLNRTNATTVSGEESNFTFVGLSNAIHSYFINCTDALSNAAGGTTKIFTSDITLPNVTNVVAFDYIIKKTASAQISAILRDNIDVRNGSVNGTAMTYLGSNVWQATLTPASIGCNEDGACRFFVKAWDIADNLNDSEYVDVTVDDTNPGINESSVSSRTVKASTSIIITARVSDANNLSGVTANNVSMAFSSANATHGNLWSVTTTPTAIGCAADGNCTVNLTVTDNAGNTNYTLDWTYVDNNAPAIVVNGSVVNMTNTTLPSYEIVFNFTDALSTGINCSLILDGRVNATNLTTANDTLTSLYLTNLTEAAHGYVIECTDGYGNAGRTGNYTITRDVTAPAITANTSSASMVLSTTTVQFDLFATDNLVGVIEANVSGLAMTRMNATGWQRNATPAQVCSGVSDGNCWVNFSIRDGAGNGPTTSNLNITVDTTRPSVNETNVSRRHVGPATAVTLQANVSDTNNVTSVKANGVVMTFLYQRSWQVTTTATALGCSAYNCTVTFNATDPAGDFNDTTTEWLTFDGTAPAVSAIAPLAAANTSNATVAYWFNISDSNATAFNCTLYVNGTANKANLSAEAVAQNLTTAALSDGVYSASVACTDDVGNTGSNATFAEITKDATAPVLGTPEASDSIVKSADTVTFTVTATDATSGIHNVSIAGLLMTMLNATAWQRNATPAQVCPGVTDGNCWVNVTAFDGADVAASTSLNITVDETRPSVNETAMSSHLVKAGTALTVRVNISETNNVSSVLARNVTMDFSSGVTWIKVTTAAQLGCAADGYCNISFNVTDNAGNYNDTAWDYVNVDNTAPAIVVNGSVVNMTNTSSQNYTVLFNYTDASSTAINCSLILDGIVNATNLTTANDTLTRLQFTYLAAGSHLWHVECTDNVSNLGKSGIYNLMYDTSPPVISNISVDDSIIQSTATATFTLDATDDSGVASVLMNATAMTYLNGSTWRGTGTPAAALCAGLANGNCWVNFTATDNAGTPGYGDKNITIDDTKPVANESVLSSRYVKAGTALTLYLLVNDANNVTAVLANNVSMDFLSQNASGKLWMKVTSAAGLGCAADGNCTITFNATDPAGNWNTTADWTFVDNTGPVVSAIAPLAAAYTTNTSIDWWYNISDAGTGTTFNCTLYFGTTRNFSNGSAVAAVQNLTISGLADATYTGLVYCSDTLGNTAGNTSFATLTVDTAKPVANESAVSSRYVKAGTALTLYLLVNDANNVTAVLANNVSMDFLSQNASGKLWMKVTSAAGLGCAADGNCTITFNATDPAGNWNTTADWTVTDNTRPGVNESSFSASTVTTWTTITVSVNITDDNNMTSVYARNESLTFLSGKTWSASTTAAQLGCPAEGNCNVSFNATDQAGNYNDTTYALIQVDNTAPVVNVNASVVNQTNTTSATYPVVFNYTDTTSSSINCSLILDGRVNATNAATANDTMTTLDLTYLTEAAHWYLVECTDSLANAGRSGNYTITRDSTQPALTSPSVDDTIVMSDQTVKVTVDASDNIAVVAVNVSGLAMTQLNATSWQRNDTPANLCSGVTNGNCWLNFTGRDAAGNLGTNNTNVTVDNTKPAVSDPSVNATVASIGKSVQVRVNVTDTNNLTTLEANSVSMGFLQAAIWYVNTTGTALGCSEGTCTITFNATDPAGNYNDSVTTSVYIDGVPVLRINASVINNTNTTASTYNLAYNITDNYTANMTCGIYFDSSLNSTNTSTQNDTMTFVTLAGYGYGSHTWYATCTDGSGSAATSAIYAFTYAPTAPTVNLMGTIVNNTNTTAQNYTVTFNYTHATDNNLNCSLILDSKANATNTTTQNNTQSNLTLTYMSQATHTWYAECTGAAGQKGQSSTYALTYDITAPALSGMTSSDTDNVSRSDQTLAITVTATDSIGVITANVSGLAMTNTAGNSWQRNDTPANLCAGVTNGNCWLNFTARDGTGNVGAADFNITIDNTNPGINESTVSTRWVNAGAALTVTARTNDLNNVSGVTANNVSMSFSSANATHGNLWSATTTAAAIGCAADGNCTVNLTVTDKAGNTNYTLDWTWVDNTAPVVIRLAPNSSLNYTTTSVYYNFSVTDNNDTAFNCTVYLDGARNATNASVAAGAAGLVALGNADGTHTAIIACTDDATNTGVSAYFGNITIDTAAPTVTHNYPSVQYQNISTNSPVINVTVADSGSGVSLASLVVSVNYTLYTSSNMTCTGTTASYTCTVTASVNDQLANLWVNVTAADQLGLTATSNLRFGINTRAPWYDGSSTAATQAANITGGNESSAGAGTFTFTGNVSATAAANITSRIAGPYTFTDNVTTNASLLGNVTWTGQTLYVNLSNRTINLTVNGTNYEINYYGQNGTYDYNASTNVTHVCTFINAQVNSTLCFNQGNKFYLYAGYGPGASITINPATANTWLGFANAGGEASSGAVASRGNFTFNVTVDTTAKSIVFPVGTYNSTYVVSVINTQFGTPVAALWNASDANSTISLYSSTTGNNSNITIGTETGTGGILGFNNSNTTRGQPFMRGNFTFNVTVDQVAYSIVFQNGTAYNTSAVVSLINTQAVATIAALRNASDDLSNLTLMSSIVGNQSQITIGTEAGTNAILGFTTGGTAQGANVSFSGITLSRYDVQSGGVLWLWVHNWTDDFQVHDVWLQKTGDESKYNVTAINANTTSTSINYSVTEADVGTLFLRMYANDTYGNVNRTIEFNATVLDNLPPEISIISPTGGSTVTNSIFNVSVNVTEGTPASNLCTWTLNDSVNSGTLTSSGYSSKTGNMRAYIIGLSLISDGVYNFNITCNQSNGVGAKANVTFTVADTTAPQIIASAPSGEQSTTGTTLDVTVSATTDEPATCRYSTTNVSFGNMTGNLTGSALTHTMTISYTADDTSEIFYVLCRDSALNVMSHDNAKKIDYSVNVAEAATEERRHGGGSSGGGGTTTQEVVHKYTEIVADSPVSIVVDKPAFTVTEVSLTTTDSLTDVTFTIGALGGKPSATATPPAAVYKYFKIDHKNVENGQIKGMTITFRVEKSWMAANNIGKAQVSLFRWDGSLWNELSTTAGKEDDKYAYFTAKSPGLSYFMVGRNKVAPPVPPPVPPEVKPPVTEQPPAPTAPPAETKETGTTETKEPPVEKQENKVWLPIVIIVVLAAAILFILLRNRGKKGEAYVPPVLDEPKQ